MTVISDEIEELKIKLKTAKLQRWEVQDEIKVKEHELISKKQAHDKLKQEKQGEVYQLHFDQRNRAMELQQDMRRKLEKLQKLHSFNSQKLCLNALKTSRDTIDQLQLRNKCLQFENYNIDKNIYVTDQGAGVNDFSVHMVPPLNMPYQKGNAYLSISNSRDTFDNGQPIAAQSTIRFFNPKFDKTLRIFTAVIYWPKTYQGADREEWTLIFSEDLKTIESGSKIVSLKVDGQVCHERELYPGEYKLLE